MKSIYKKTNQLLLSLSVSVFNNRQIILITKKTLPVALEKKRILLLATFIFAIHCLSFGQGSTYVGSYNTSAPIVLSGISNLTISNLQIVNPNGECISLTNCSNITIQNCKLGPSKMEGIYLYNCTNVTITNCSMEKVRSGVLAEHSSRITFERNEVKNMNGPSPHGQMIQLAYCSGGGHSIRYNISENILGESYPEDIVNIYMSSGTADSPIIISNNWIRGGGPSSSGGGIMIGDNGGSYTFVENNILVDPGQYGIAIAGGHHNTIKNNKVYGKQQSFTNVGVYAWEQYGLPCHDLTISNNEVNYKSKSGSLNNWWFADNVGIIGGASTNVYNPNLNASILPTTIIGRAKQVVTEVTPTPTEENYNIYSSPAFGHSIFVTSKTPNNDKIAIYNLNGQKIIEQSTNDTRTEINTNSMASGVYIVKISNNEKTIEVKKIIINKN